MYTSFDQDDLSQITLEKLHFELKDSFPGVVFEDITMQHFAEQYTGRIVTHISGNVLTNRHTVIEHESVPKDWWEFFKLRFLPSWLLKRMPVQYRRIAIIVNHYQLHTPS